MLGLEKSLRSSLGKNTIRKGLCVTVLSVSIVALFAPDAYPQSLLFNGQLNRGPERWRRPDAAHVQRLRAAGWTCPDSAQWPALWRPRGSNMTFKAFPAGGKLGMWSAS